MGNKYMDALGRLTLCAKGDQRYNGIDVVLLADLIARNDETERENINIREYCDICETHENDLLKEIDKYKKALDKACEALVWFSSSEINCEDTTCANCKYKSSYCESSDKNDWKEWLLKDE